MNSAAMEPGAGDGAAGSSRPGVDSAAVASTVLGIDYGGTNTKLVLIRAGEVLRTDSVPTGTLEALTESVRSLSSSVDSQPAAFGLSAPGLIEPGTGRVLRSVNLPWLDGRFPAEELSSRLGLPGAIVNDGESAALAEAQIGAGEGCEDVFVMALGTGIAGAHVLGGVVRRGAHGSAGEVGHMRFSVEGHRCSCGGAGCLETVIGGTRMAERWRERGGMAAAGADARVVVEAAQAGDAAALATLESATDALARAFVEVTALIDPALIVVGGGVAGAYEWTVQPAIEKAAAAATFHTLPRIVPAALGTWAGARGAALAGQAALERAAR